MRIEFCQKNSFRLSADVSSSFFPPAGFHILFFCIYAFCCCSKRRLIASGEAFLLPPMFPDCKVVIGDPSLFFMPGNVSSLSPSNRPCLEFVAGISTNFADAAICLVGAIFCIILA